MLIGLDGQVSGTPNITMGTRVRVKDQPELVGTVEGVNPLFMAFQYIIRLDQEHALSSGLKVRSILVIPTAIEPCN